MKTMRMDMHICAYKHITFSATTAHIILMSPTFGEDHLHLTCNMLPAIQIALFGIQLSVSLPFSAPKPYEKAYRSLQPVPSLSKNGKIGLTPPIITSKSAWLLCILAHYLGKKKPP